MNIQIIEVVKGAQQAADIAVIIDVLRAATVSAYLLEAGVTSIVPVSSSEEAFKMKEANSNVLLVGEDKGITIPGFDLGNSPSVIQRRNDLRGAQAIHCSSTGTRGLINAKKAREIIFGSFVAAGAILKYLKKTTIERYHPSSYVCSRRFTVC